MADLRNFTKIKSDLKLCVLKDNYFKKKYNYCFFCKS